MLKHPTTLMYDYQDVEQYRSILQQIQMYDYVQSLSKAKKTKVQQDAKWLEIIQPLLVGGQVPPTTPPPTPQSSKTPLSMPMTRVTRSQVRQKDSSGRGLYTSTPRNKVNQTSKSGEGIKNKIPKHLLNIAKALTKDK